MFQQPCMYKPGATDRISAQGDRAPGTAIKIGGDPCASSVGSARDLGCPDIEIIGALADCLRGQRDEAKCKSSELGFHENSSVGSKTC